MTVPSHFIGLDVSRHDFAKQAIVHTCNLPAGLGLRREAQYPRFTWTSS
jgi:hypothetical protein